MFLVYYLFYSCSRIFHAGWQPIILLILLYNAKRSGVVSFVRYGDMACQFARFKPVFERTVQDYFGFAAGSIAHFAVPPGHGHAHAQADGFAKRFFGRKAGGQVAQAALGPSCAALLPGFELGFAQDFGGKALAVAVKAGANAANVANVGADAVNHLQRCPKAGAWRAKLDTRRAGRNFTQTPCQCS